jgi:hypothetical protein
MNPLDNAKEKLSLIDWIVKQDKLQQLKAVATFIESLDKESTDSAKVVGYRHKGAKVTMAQLKERIAESVRLIEKNQVVSFESLEQDSDRW